MQKSRQTSRQIEKDRRRQTGRQSNTESSIDEDIKACRQKDRYKEADRPSPTVRHSKETQPKETKTNWSRNTNRQTDRQRI